MAGVPALVWNRQDWCATIARAYAVRRIPADGDASPAQCYPEAGWRGHAFSRSEDVVRV